MNSLQYNYTLLKTVQTIDVNGNLQNFYKFLEMCILNKYTVGKKVH